MTPDRDSLRKLAAEAREDDYIHVRAPNLLALLDGLEAAERERDEAVAALREARAFIYLTGSFPAAKLAMELDAILAKHPVQP